MANLSYLNTMAGCFLVSKKDSGQHPASNKSNAFIEARHFMMECIPSPNLLKQRDLLVKVDLNDAYYSISISPDHKKYAVASSLVAALSLEMRIQIIMYRR